jgi:hypothetical protein
MMAMPSAFFVYSVLLAQASPAPGLQATWPAEFYAGATASHFSQDPSYAGWQGDASASATWYVVRPLVDDGSPLAIQSFLQRLSDLRLSCGGTAIAGSDSASPYRYNSRAMHVSPSGFFYLGDMILGAGVYYDRGSNDTKPADGSAEQHHTSQLFYPWATVGLRADTFEVYGTYRYRTYYADGAKQPSTWGQGIVELRNILDKAIYWRIDGYTLTGGGGGGFDVEVFFQPTLGVWLSGYLESGRIYVSSTNEYWRQGGEIGVGWWASHSFELQFSLAASSTSRNGGNYPAVTMVGVTLGVVLRGPQHYRAQPETRPPGDVPVPAGLPELDTPPPPAETEPAETPESD